MLIILNRFIEIIDATNNVLVYQKSFQENMIEKSIPNKWNTRQLNHGDIKNNKLKQADQ